MRRDGESLTERMDHNFRERPRRNHPNKIEGREDINILKMYRNSEGPIAYRI